MATIEDAIDQVVMRMQSRLDAMPPPMQQQRYFLGTYLRTTIAVGKAVNDARFEDPAWVRRWDVAFAELYLDAYDAALNAQRPPRPWRLAFDAPAELPPLRHVLLGINAHINFDLPQALLAVISEPDFEDDVLIARRQRDHERIDGVLSARVSAEDEALTVAGGKAVLDWLLTPLNRLSSRRFLREAREKVWHNTLDLHRARMASAEAYAARLAELELLSAARIADLLAPGQVLLKLAVGGFGVILPPA